MHQVIDLQSDVESITTSASTGDWDSICINQDGSQWVKGNLIVGIPPQKTQQPVITSGTVYFDGPKLTMYPTEGNRILVKGQLTFFFESLYPVRVVGINDDVICECGEEMILADDSITVIVRPSGYEDDMWVDYGPRSLPMPGYTCHECERSILRTWGL